MRLWLGFKSGIGSSTRVGFLAYLPSTALLMTTVQTIPQAGILPGFNTERHYYFYTCRHPASQSRFKSRVHLMYLLTLKQSMHPLGGNFPDKSLSFSQATFKALFNQPQADEQVRENVLWTADYKKELPIRLGETGFSSLSPTTLQACFLKTVAEKGDSTAMSQKVNGEWVNTSFKQYFYLCVNFAKSVMSLGIQKSTINIMGFNSPEWFISAFGSMFCQCIPVGIYTTSSLEVCEYIATQSECQLVIAETYDLARKYARLLEKGDVKWVVVYGNQESLTGKDTFSNRIILWKEFLQFGKNVPEERVISLLKSAEPGSCCSIIYTSGTTGPPKGVMLSHDNITWIEESILLKIKYQRQFPFRIVSYLPLSHIAAFMLDMVISMMEGGHTCFADPDALQGSLMGTLREAKPTFFLGVPRVWEKIYLTLMEVSKSSGWLKSKIASFAKEHGHECIQEHNNQPTSLQYKISKVMVYGKIRKALGLEEAKILIFGAAPLNSDVRRYFLSIGFLLTNVYGMSEAAGPITMSESQKAKANLEYMDQAGTPMLGTEVKIVKVNPNDSQGEICSRGRHTFMGYYKNPEETSKVLDSEGFLRSGDLGYFDENGVLFVSGRLKELIITAAGENIPPLIIEQNIKSKLPWLGNVVVIGEQKKHLTCLIVLNAADDNLSKETLAAFQEAGIKVNKLSEAIKQPKVRDLIYQGVKKANQIAISRAQTVKTFAILPNDFSIEQGTLTPTLKLKRKQISKKYAPTIDSLYLESKI